jgi:hypothetical protein
VFYIRDIREDICYPSLSRGMGCASTAQREREGFCRGGMYRDHTRPRQEEHNWHELCAHWSRVCCNRRNMLILLITARRATRLTRPSRRCPYHVELRQCYKNIFGPLYFSVRDNSISPTTYEGRIRGTAYNMADYVAPCSLGRQHKSFSTTIPIAYITTYLRAMSRHHLLTLCCWHDGTTGFSPMQRSSPCK